MYFWREWEGFLLVVYGGELVKLDLVNIYD